MLCAVRLQERTTRIVQDSGPSDDGFFPYEPVASRQPLAPWLYRAKPWKSGEARWKAVLVLVGCIALGSLCAWLKPDDSWIGTSSQLGLAPCSLPTLVGIPCPTCGMTTAFAHAIRGEWLASFRAQPAGFVGALAIGVIGIVALDVLVTGKVWLINWYCVSSGWVVAILAGLFIAGWCYKIATWPSDGAMLASR